MALRSSRVAGVRLPFGLLIVAFGEISTFFRSNVVRNDSTWLYPSAQKIFVATDTAPVAPFGNSGGSNSRNHVCPFPSMAVKPGWTPDVFSLMSVQCEG